MATTLMLGDCLEVLKTLPDASVDALICDPPAGIAFMGKAWDSNKGGRDHWIAWLAEVLTECRRVMKPGAYALVWALPRTSHWTGMAIEDAGLVPRDQIAHMFGSGFPKSHSISKALDRMAVPGELSGFIEEVRAAAKVQGYTYRSLNDALGGQAIAEHVLKPSASNAAWPTRDTYDALRGVLNLDDKWDWLYADVRGAERPVIGSQRVPDARHSAPVFAAMTAPDGRARMTTVDITAPATDLARQWEGYGTSLKPGHEIWWLAQKPLEGTYAANVTRWGVGGLNIDGCRIGGGQDRASGGKSGENRGIYSPRTPGYERPTGGRWPANVVLDEAAGAELDAQTGDLAVVGGPKKTHGSGGLYNMGSAGAPGTIYRDTGGASRFFYCAKASRSERGEGLDGMPERLGGTMDGGHVVSEGRTAPKTGRRPTQNHHPTVKPLALMRWLCRLVCPPGGVVLDPFMGSASTGCAAILEGFNFVGIEKEEEYFAIAQARIDHFAAGGTVKPGGVGRSASYLGLKAGGKDSRRKVQVCPACDRRWHSGAKACEKCGGPLEWRDEQSERDARKPRALPLFGEVAD